MKVFPVVSLMSWGKIFLKVHSWRVHCDMCIDISRNMRLSSWFWWEIFLLSLATLAYMHVYYFLIFETNIYTLGLCPDKFQVQYTFKFYDLDFKTQFTWIVCLFFKQSTKFLLLQFPLPHSRGSSHGQSRIIRYAYSDKIYADMMQEAYPMWHQLEKETNTTLYRYDPLWVVLIHSLDHPPTLVKHNYGEFGTMQKLSHWKNLCVK